VREPTRQDSLATSTRARRLEVARALGAVLPADCLLSQEEELRPYE